MHPCIHLSSGLYSIVFAECPDEGWFFFFPLSMVKRKFFRGFAALREFSLVGYLWTRTLFLRCYDIRLIIKYRRGTSV